MQGLLLQCPDYSIAIKYSLPTEQPNATTTAAVVHTAWSILQCYTCYSFAIKCSPSQPMQPNARSTAPMQGLLLHFNFQLCHRVRFWLALGDFRCFQWQTTKHTRANAQSIQRHAWAHTDTDTHTKHTHTCVCVQAKLVKSINMSVHKTRKITRKITRKTMKIFILRSVNQF